MSTRKAHDSDRDAGLLTPSGKSAHSRAGSSDRSHDADKHGKTRMRPLSGPAPAATIVVQPSEIIRKGWMVMKDHKRYFVLKSGDLIWWNEQPQDKFELTAQAVHSKIAGHIPLASILMVVRDELSVNLLADSGSTYSTKCTSNDEAEEWVKALNGATGTTERSKREDKYGWVTYDDKRRILYLGQGKLDILDGHLNLRRVIPLEGRSVRAEGNVSFELFSTWSVYEFECANAKERNSWVRRISMQIIRANTRFEDQVWERKGFLALNNRKSCFFGLKSGKLYYYRSAKQGTGKRFVLADCTVTKVDTGDDSHIEITLKGVKHTLRAHSKRDLEAWFAALQGAQKGAAVASTGAVFGSPLSKVVASPAHARSGTPNVVLDCVLYLDQPASFATQGLFHQSVDLQFLAPWVSAYNAGSAPNFAAVNASFSSVACLLKHFIKCLPEPLIPESLQDDVLTHRADSIELRHVFARLPAEARSVLRPLFELLNNLAFESRLESNSAVELAAMITPLVLWRRKSAEADADEEDLFLLKSVMAVGTLIARYDDVFEEVQPEVLALKKEVGSDTFDQLLAQLAGATPVPAAATAKKPLPSLEDWAKELRSGPARPLLPEAFLQAAAERDHEDGLDELAALEKELQEDKKDRNAVAAEVGVVVVQPVEGEDTAAIRAARPKKKGVRIADDAEQTKMRVQNATIMRTLRSSRKSRLTPEELAALKAKLETQIGSGTVHTSEEKEALKKRFATEPGRKKKPLPRNDTAISTLDDLFDELQQEKATTKLAMLQRITTSQRLIQARQSSNPKLQNLDVAKFLREQAGVAEDKVPVYAAILELNGIDGSHLHLLTADYLAELGVPAPADRAAIVEAVKRFLSATPRT